MVNKIFGKKLGMTRYFLDEGKCVPVTLVKAGPCVVIQKKTTEKDGYDAIQVGFQEQKKKRIIKPLQGHFEKAGEKYFRILKEIKVEDPNEFELGQEIKSDIFNIGEYVKVSGSSKGRGFSGVIKRWGFSGGRKTHGSRSHRISGSIGQTATPGRVYKGKKLPGRMGCQKTTVKNLIILDVRPEIDLIALKGTLPGARNNIIEITKI
ncbi:MAG: 50S ribosomal protein L3 [Deltaproteobacteria bacterium]|nr:50S ribosomal protein L3 [Deltaproteobacteria bacterium]